MVTVNQMDITPIIIKTELLERMEKLNIKQNNILHRGEEIPRMMLTIENMEHLKMKINIVADGGETIPHTSTMKMLRRIGGIT